MGNSVAWVQLCARRLSPKDQERDRSIQCTGHLRSDEALVEANFRGILDHRSDGLAVAAGNRDVQRVAVLHAD